LETFFLARQIAALSSFELCCDCIFVTSPLLMQKEALCGLRQNRKSGAHYQANKRRMTYTSFAIGAYARFAYCRAAAQRAEETAATI
jgi:hypothetical protein